MTMLSNHKAKSMEEFLIAAEGGDISTVELIVRSKADELDVFLEKDGYEALFYAAEGGHIDVVNFLLNHGWDIESISPDNRRRPLHAAVGGGNIEIVSLLVDRCLIIDAKDEEGYTALHLAVLFGEHDMVKLLVDHGARVDSAALRHAVSTGLRNGKGCLELVKFLLSQGSSVQLSRSIEGRSALDEALHHRRAGFVGGISGTDLERLIQLLASMGASLGIRVVESVGILRDCKFSKLQFPVLADTGSTSNYCPPTNRMMLALLRKEKQVNCAPEGTWTGDMGRDSGPMLLLGGGGSSRDADMWVAGEEEKEPELMKSYAAM